LSFRGRNNLLMNGLVHIMAQDWPESAPGRFCDEANRLRDEASRGGPRLGAHVVRFTAKLAGAARSVRDETRHVPRFAARLSRLRFSTRSNLRSKRTVWQEFGLAKNCNVEARCES
jgi:hypothetical protein